jgi:hypothetical protein
MLNPIYKLHRDESGTISIMTVFCMLFFTFLLLMLANIAKHVDDKVKMQNAVDASTYSGGVVLARGMNAIAYSNHLLCDVFAMTSMLREGRDRNAEKVVPSVLQAWTEYAPRFSNTQFHKFPPVGPLIQQMIPVEQEAVTAYSELLFAASNTSLATFEYILSQRLIPKYQRDLLINIPQLSQQVTMEIAMRHGLTDSKLSKLSGQVRDGSVAGDSKRGHLIGLLWRTEDIMPVGEVSESDPDTRTIPMVDADPSGTDFNQYTAAPILLVKAQALREMWGRNYRLDWIEDKMELFDKTSKLSRYADFWRIATCGQMQILFAEYPTSNLPMMLRLDVSGDYQNGIEPTGDPLVFVGVNYRKHTTELGPGMFTNQANRTSDAQTFAQIELFLPRDRYRCCPWTENFFDGRGDFDYEVVHGDGFPQNYDSFSQNWQVRLMPATSPKVSQIISANKSQYLTGLRPTYASNLSPTYFESLNTH